MRPGNDAQTVLELCFERSTVAQAILDPEGKPRHVNQAFLSLFGLTDVDELADLNILTHPGLPEGIRATLEAAEAVDFETTIDLSTLAVATFRTDTIAIHVTIVPLDVGHTEAGFLLQILDHTEQRRVRDALLESEERYRTLLDNLDSGLVLFDEDLRVVEFHDTSTNLLGFEPDKIRGKSVSDLHPEGLVVPDRVVQAFSRILETGESLRLASSRFSRSGPDGSRDAWMDMSIFRVILSGRRYVACGIIDVTDRQVLQEQLLQGQKMESIGRLASGLAHDFNNLLAGILGNASLLELQPMSDEEVAATATEIKNAARRAADLTSRMMTFSRKKPPRREPVDITDSIRAVTQLLERARPPGLTMELDLGVDLPCISADPAQLETALMNLLVNAADAMPGGGTLTISARSMLVDQWKPGTNPAVGEGRWLRLTISDTGTGMDEQTRSRIFEPFFTTKDSGKGTGLGLYTVYGIVQGHGGQISVASEPDRGTTFDLYFPVHEVSSPRTTRTSIGPPMPGHGTILVVDDEEIIRTTISSMLSRLGYTAISASDGAEALDILDDGEGVDLVILDMLMDGMDGASTFQRIREKTDPPHVLLMSGQVDSSHVEGLIKTGARGFLAKPFTLSRLSRSVRFALKG